ncbi:MAG: glycosyltransferase family 39 protein [Candidatus Curtissbacteria bacterium]|nr:glycosyltransferase family 39 protein [Candidatus Curtissbacteria bacterium]
MIDSHGHKRSFSANKQSLRSSSSTAGLKQSPSITQGHGLRSLLAKRVAGLSPWSSLSSLRASKVTATTTAGSRVPRLLEIDKKRISRFLSQNYLLIVILVSASIVLSLNINKPFWGHHDWNGAWYSNFARNFLRYGLIETKFGSVMNTGVVSPDGFHFFTHYPPLLPILLFLSFSTFGIHEWSARLVPLIFTLATIVAIYAIGNIFFNKRIAILAALFSTVMPIVIYFGKMPVQETLVIAPVLLSVIAYFKFFEKPNRKNSLILVSALVFSHLINWPAYYVTPLFSAHWILFSKNKSKKFTFLLFLAISLMMFGVHMLHTAWLTRDLIGGGLIDVLKFRLNIGEQLMGYSHTKFLELQARWITVYFTRPILFFSAIALIWIFINLIKRRFPKKTQILLMLGIFGVTHNLVFRNMAFIHDYMIIYLWPFLALSASFGFFILVERLKIPRNVVPLLIVLVLTLCIQERFDFTKALILSNGFVEGVEVGKLVNSNTKEGEQTLILSESFKENYEVFINYYSDRRIDYYLPSDENLLQARLSQQDYKLMVAMPQRDTNEATLKFLQRSHKQTKIDNYLLFVK